MSNLHCFGSYGSYLRGSWIALDSSWIDEKNDPTFVPHVDRQEGGGIKKALFGKVVSAAESDPQTTLACSTGLFGFLRSSNGAQTISGEAALEWKNVRKWVVQDIFEAVGPPWFSAGLTLVFRTTRCKSPAGS